MPSSNRGGTSPRHLPDVATDRWTMSGQWATRPEDVSQSGHRLLRFLEGIGPLDPSLRQWFWNAKPVTLDAASLTNLLRKGKDHQFDEHGWTTAIWNGVPEPPGQSTFTVTCGVTASYLKNKIDFALPRPAGAGELYQLENMLKLIETTISAWQLSWCSVGPYGIWEAAGRGDSIGVFASWIVYLDNSLITRLGDLPYGVRKLDVAQGSLFVMAPTPAELSLEVIDAVQQNVLLDPSWRLS